MHGSGSVEVGLCVLQRSAGIPDKVACHTGVQPQRSTFDRPQPTTWRRSLGKRLNLGPAQASVPGASLVRQEPFITQVDDVLSGSPEDRCRFAGSDQVVIAHASMVSHERQKHKKHKKHKSAGFTRECGDVRG